MCLCILINYIHERSCEKSHNVTLSLFSTNIYSNNICKYSKGNWNTNWINYLFFELK